MGTQDFSGSEFTFTEAAIRQACRLVEKGDIDADQSGRRSWRDSATRGLTILCSRSGAAAYYFVGKQAGRTVRKALGDPETVRLSEAQRAASAMRYGHTVAGAITPRQRAAQAGPTLGEVAVEYLDAHEAGEWLPGSRTAAPSARTMKFYRDLRKAHLEAHEGLTLTAFAEALPGIHRKIKAKAPVQADRFLQLVRNVYAFAADRGAWQAVNPAIGSNKTNRLARSKAKPRTRVLSDTEWKRLDRAMSAEPALWGDLFRTSVATLQRMGAVRCMRWADIDLGRDPAWRILSEYMKGRASGHVVPLADLPDVVTMLRRRRKEVPKDCPWVFPAPETAGPVVNYKGPWKRIIEAAGLDSEDRDRRPRPHDLRRTGGARMTTAGVPLQTVTRALGDAPSSVSMVAKTYAMVADDALRDAYAKTRKKGGRR